MTDSTTNRSSTNAWYDRAEQEESNQRPLGPPAFEMWRCEYGELTPACRQVAEFAAARGLNTGPFARMGARVNREAVYRAGRKYGAGTVLGFPFTAGIKYRSVDPGVPSDKRRWSWGQFKHQPLNIYYGWEPHAWLLVAESETDAAALIELYRDCDVALMPVGAHHWYPLWTEQLMHYSNVLVATDNDEGGEIAWKKISAALPRAVGHGAPDGVKDWSEWLEKHPEAVR